LPAARKESALAVVGPVEPNRFNAVGIPNRHFKWAGSSTAADGAAVILLFGYKHLSVQSVLDTVLVPQLEFEDATVRTAKVLRDEESFQTG